MGFLFLPFDMARADSAVDREFSSNMTLDSFLSRRRRAKERSHLAAGNFVVALIAASGFVRVPGG